MCAFLYYRLDSLYIVCVPVDAGLREEKTQNHPHKGVEQLQTDVVGSPSTALEECLRFLIKVKLNKGAGQLRRELA